MSMIYVIDTETSTTRWDDGIPDGHIVEIGVARVDLDELTVVPMWNTIVKDENASDRAWIFRNSSLTKAEVLDGNNRRAVEDVLARKLMGCEVTSFNIGFDRMMIERDMPRINENVHWGQDIMVQAAQVEDIPRTHAGEDKYPKAETSYNILCPDDPCRLKGHELHRAIADAEMEGYILLELFIRGLWKPRKVTE